MHWELGKMDLLKEVSDSDFIIETIGSGIQTITINRPEKKNAINASMYTKIVNLLQMAAENSEVTLTVVTGIGDFFTSGNDFTSSTSAILEGGDDAAKNMLFRYKTLVNALIDYPKLLIALVNGPAIGIGFTVLPLFDIVYCTDKTYFHAPFSKLGIVPEGCSTYTFPKIFGSSKTNEILLCNYKLPADEAYKFGFVSAVIKQTDFEKSAWKKIEKLVHLDQRSIVEGKKMLRNVKLLHQVNESESEVLFKLYKEKVNAVLQSSL